MALRFAQGGRADPSAVVGRLYAANTVGSVVGTILGSFLLVPLLGTRGALVFLAWLAAPLAFMVIRRGLTTARGRCAAGGVITEEPPLVHTAGVVNLYSRDFYRLCEERLTDNGIMAVWLATWDLEDRDVRMLVRAFVDVFPHASAWDSNHLGEWILIGSKQRLALDAQKLQQRMSETVLAQDLAKIGIRSPADLLALYLKGRDFLAAYSKGVPPVTDDRSVVDYTTPRQARANYGLGDFMVGGHSLAGVGPNGLVSEVRFRDFDAIYTHRDRVEPFIVKPPPGTQDPLFKDLAEKRAQAEVQVGRRIARNIMASALDFTQLRRPERAFDVLERGISLVGNVPGADLLVLKATLQLKAGRALDARETLSRALELDPKNSAAATLGAQMGK